MAFHRLHTTRKRKKLSTGNRASTLSTSSSLKSHHSLASMAKQFPSCYLLILQFSFHSACRFFIIAHPLPHGLLLSADRPRDDIRCLKCKLSSQTNNLRLNIHVCGTEQVREKGNERATYMQKLLYGRSYRVSRELNFTSTKWTHTLGHQMS